MASPSDSEEPSAQRGNFNAIGARSDLLAERNGYILFCPTGMLTVSEVASQFEQLRHRIAIERRAGKPGRLLIDLSHAAVQPKETAAFIQDNSKKLYEAGDRIVLLVEGTIQKLQIKRIAAGLDYQIVQSVAEGEALLQVD